MYPRMDDCILAYIQYAPVHIWTAEQRASVFHSFIHSSVVRFFFFSLFETSMEVDCKAHTTESETWLTL